MKKIELNWPAVAVVSVIALCVTALAIAKVIPGHVVVAVATGVAGWIAPSPVQKVEAP